MNDDPTRAEPLAAAAEAAPRRPLLAIAGWLLTALGFIGAALPLIPTTPFLLLAAWCFARSSPRLHRWLLNHPKLGPVLSSWKESRSIPASAKRKAYVVVVLSFGFSIAMISSTPLRIMLVVLGLGVITFLATLRTAPTGPQAEDASQNRA